MVMVPIALTDEQLEIVRRAAEPLRPRGPGPVPRIGCRPAQRP